MNKTIPSKAMKALKQYADLKYSVENLIADQISLASSRLVVC